MTKFFIEALIWGLCCGIVATAYRAVLAYEDYFTKWWQFGARYEGRWFFKPVWSCSHCTGGQLALWTYFLLKILPALVQAIRLNGWLYPYSIHYARQGAAGLFGLIIAISTAILAAKVLTWIIEEKIK
jgi:hypothetical protein